MSDSFCVFRSFADSALPLKLGTAVAPILTVATVPAGVVLVASLALGPGAAIGAVFGAALTGVPLGLFWAATREATASLQSRLPAGSTARRALREAFDAPTGWRIAASVLAVTVAALAVVVVFAPATTFLGS